MHKIDMDKKYIVGIDIGSSKLSMAVGIQNDNGEMSILGVDVQEVEDCVKNGDIVNYMELGNIIAKSRRALEQELDITLHSAYVGVSGRSVYCVRYEDYVEISNASRCVTEHEMRELRSRIDMVVPGGGDEIVDRIPLRYCIDDRQDVNNPIGAYGRKLSATYLFVMVGKQQIDLVNRAMHQAGNMKVSGLCVNPTLLPKLLLNSNEMNEGTMIVDLGGDVTDLSIVHGGKLWYFSSLPIGASSINNDLRDFLQIPKKDIELLKRRNGSAMADNVAEDEAVTVKTTGRAKKQILKRNVAEIAEERLKDIINFVGRELKAAMFASKIPCGVVLTGGSAYLADIDELFARELNVEVRLGQILNGLDYESQQKVCAFNQSAVLGLLLYGAEHNGCDVGQSSTDRPMEKPKTVWDNVPEMGSSIKPLVATPPQPVATPPQPVVTPPQPITPPEPTKSVEMEDKPKISTVKETVTPQGDGPVLETEPSENVVTGSTENNNGEQHETPNVEKPEPTPPTKPTKPEAPKKPGMFSRFKRWVDGVFDEDEYL